MSPVPAPWRGFAACTPQVRGLAALVEADAQAPASNALPAASAKLQPLDYTTLAACAAELRHSYCPAFVEQAVQATPHSLLLRLRTVDTVAWLSISWDVNHAHVSIRPSLPQRSTEAEAYSFGQQLNANLKGAVLSDVELPRQWDRIIDLSFAPRLGDAVSHHLVCEIMGRYSNVVLTNAASPGIVLAAAKQVGHKMTQHRHVQVGKGYSLPPTALAWTLPSSPTWPSCELSR